MPHISLVRALFAALLLAVVAPAVALGVQPVRFHDHFTDSFPTDICGISVNADITVTDKFFANADGSFKDTTSVRQTFTNPLKVASRCPGESAGVASARGGC